MSVSAQTVVAARFADATPGVTVCYDFLVLHLASDGQPSSEVTFASACWSG